MAGRLPPRTQRTPTQIIESGHGLTQAQRDVYAAWDAQILLLRLKSRSHDQIAAEVGCSVHHVRKRVPHLLDQHAKQFTEEASREIPLQLAALDILLGEVRLQWERSCLDKVETTSETEGGGTYRDTADGALESVPGGKFKQKSKESRVGQTGDPRLIEQIRAILADRRKLLRLDKDEMLAGALASANFTQININAGDGPMVPITAMTPQALAETAELLAALGMNPDGTPIKKLAQPEDIDGDFTEEAITVARTMEKQDEQ